MCAGAVLFVFTHPDNSTRTSGSDYTLGGAPLKHGDPSHTTCHRITSNKKVTKCVFVCLDDAIVCDPSEGHGLRSHGVKLKTAPASCEPSHSRNSTSGTGCPVLEARAWIQFGGAFLSRVNK